MDSILVNCTENHGSKKGKDGLYCSQPTVKSTCNNKWCTQLMCKER